MCEWERIVYQLKHLLMFCLNNLLVNVSVCLSVVRETLRMKEQDVSKVRMLLDQTVTVCYLNAAALCFGTNRNKGQVLHRTV